MLSFVTGHGNVWCLCGTFAAAAAISTTGVGTGLGITITVDAGTFTVIVGACGTGMDTTSETVTSSRGKQSLKVTPAFFAYGVWMNIMHRARIDGAMREVSRAWHVASTLLPLMPKLNSPPEPAILPPFIHGAVGTTIAAMAGGV